MFFLMVLPGMCNFRGGIPPKNHICCCAKAASYPPVSWKSSCTRPDRQEWKHPAWYASRIARQQFILICMIIFRYRFLFWTYFEVSIKLCPQELLLIRRSATPASSIFTSVAILVFRYTAYELYVFCQPCPYYVLFFLLCLHSILLNYDVYW